MKAIKDCRWEITFGNTSCCYWEAYTPDNNGFSCFFESQNIYKTNRGAENNWKRVAELNGITDWKVIDE